MQDIELSFISNETTDPPENNNSTADGAATVNKNGDHLGHNPERNRLLQLGEDNNMVTSSNHQAADYIGAATRALEAMKKPIIWKLKLWMVIAIIFGVIFLIIVLSLVIPSVTYEDKDEKYDQDSFVVSRLYTGTFKLVNQNFTADLLSVDSPWRQDLSSQLQKKLSDLYTSSPALGRYFSSAGVSNFSNSSIMVHYWLQFVLPQDHGELVRYTLSTQMVRRVLRQYLYEQESQSWDPLYIDPNSVCVKVGNVTIN